MSQNDFPMINRLHPLAMFALLARTVLTYQPEKNVFGNMTTEGSYPSDTVPWLPTETRSLRSTASQPGRRLA